MLKVLGYPSNVCVCVVPERWWARWHAVVMHRRCDLLAGDAEVAAPVIGCAAWRLASGTTRSVPAALGGQAALSALQFWCQTAHLTSRDSSVLPRLLFLSRDTRWSLVILHP